MKTQVSCLQEKSLLDTEQSKCAWRNGSCSFVEPSENFKVVLYVAVFAALISTPIEYVLNKIIRNFLAKPLKSLKVAAADTQNADQILEITNGALNSESPEVLEQFDRLSQAVQGFRMTLSPENCRDFDGSI